MVEIFSYGPDLTLSELGAPVRTFPDAGAALRELESSTSDVVIVCASARAGDAMRSLPEDAGSFDLLHAGLLLGGKGAFQSLLLSSMNWLFLDAHAGRRCVSWKATPELCLVRPAAVRALGGFNDAYSSVEARLMDMAYRMLTAGGRVGFDPAWSGDVNAQLPPSKLPLEDEFLFIRRHLGKANAIIAALWLSLLFFPSLRAVKSLKKALGRGQGGSRGRRIPEVNWHLLGERRQKVGTITAIIPTINRYDYLPQAIDSLLSQRRPPDEIIVVDQTPAEIRRPDIYANYVGKNTRVIYLDYAGQSIARNTAIQSAAGEWCFLFDDDSVAWDDLIERHVAAVERSGLLISTGVSLAPWKNVGHIPEGKRHYHLTNVLDTGNSLIKRSVLLDVRGLDRAFDRGSGADNNLGTRLHLQGYGILFNPEAIRTHYKASTGGLRVHGAWWRGRTAFWAPFPPPTQIYTVQQFYPRAFWPPHYLLFFLRARRWHGPWEFAWLWLSGPWKLVRAIRAARLLKTEFMENSL